MYFGALLADKYAFGATVVFTSFNPLMGIKTAEQRIQQYGDWYTCRQWTGCYIWYSEEGPGRAATPPSPLLAVPNVTAHPSTASVPITVLLCDGPLLCGINVAIKGLMCLHLVKLVNLSF